MFKKDHLVFRRVGCLERTIWFCCTVGKENKMFKKDHLVLRRVGCSERTIWFCCAGTLSIRRDVGWGVRGGAGVKSLRTELKK